MEYGYDGSYAGLLSALQRCFSWEEVPARIERGAPTQDGLFSRTIEVGTDQLQVRALLVRMRRELSPESERNLRHAWLSEAPGVELALYHYLRLGWQFGDALDAQLARPEVARVHGLALRVRREAHRLKGLVRFCHTTDGLYYAPLEPEHCVLPLLGGHFAERLVGERWLIHDRRRGQGLLGDGRRWTLVDLKLHAEPELAPEEARWQGLWKRFFRHIAIAERANPRQQRQCMPMKYWKNLVEME